MGEQEHDSLALMREERPPAFALLSLLSFVSPTPFPTWPFDAASALPPELGQALGEAETRGGLLTELAGEGRLAWSENELTPSDDLAVRELLDEDEQARWCGIATAWLYEAFPAEPDDVRSWPRCVELAPHALAAAGHAEALCPDDVAVAGLLNRLAEYEFSRGELTPALELIGRALLHQERLGDSRLRGSILRTHGSLLIDCDEMERAREQLEKAVAVHAAVLEAEDPDLRRDRIELAEALVELDQPVQAREQLERVIAAQPDPPRDRPGCAARKVFAWTLFKLGDSKAARAEYEAALAATEELCGAEHADAARVRIGLGVLHDELHERNEARAQLERAREITEAAVGADHPRMAVIHSNLGGLLSSLGDMRAARSNLQRAVSIGQATLPETHRALWIRHRKLATVLRSLDDFAGAREQVERALSISERTVGDRSARFADDLAALGAALVALDERERARETYTRALEVAEELPDAKEAVADYTLSLGRVTREMGDLAGGRKHFRDALAKYEQIDEPSRQGASAARIELARVLLAGAEEAAAASDALGREGDAEQMRDQVRSTFIAVLEEVLDSGDLSSAIAVADVCHLRAPELSVLALERAGKLATEERHAQPWRIGAAWHRLGRARKQEEDWVAAQQAFEAAMPLLDGYPEFQGVTLHDLADIQFALGRFDEAAGLYRDALERKRDLGDGSDPRDLTATLLALGRALARASSYDDALTAYEERLEILVSLAERDTRAEGITLHELGHLRRRQRRWEEAVELYGEAAERMREARETRELTSILRDIGMVLVQQGDKDGAVRVHRERLGILSSLAEHDFQAEGVTLHDLGAVRRSQGQVDEAVDLFRQAAERKREAGVNPGDLATTLQALGRVLESDGRYEEALDAYQERLDVLAGLPKRDLKAEGVTLHDLGDVRRGQRRLEEAIGFYGEAVERKREAGDGTPEELGLSLLALGTAEFELGDRDATQSVAAEAVDLLRAEAEPDPYYLASALVLLANVIVRRGKPADAVELFTEGDKLLGQMEEGDPIELAALRALSAGTFDRLERPEDATKARAAARDALDTAFETGLPFQDLESLPTVCSLCVESDAFELAEKCLDHLRSLVNTGPDDEAVAAALAEMLLAVGRGYASQKNDNEAALRVMQERLTVLSSRRERDFLAEGVTLHSLANIRRAQDRKEEAADLFRQAVSRKRAAGDRCSSRSLALTLLALSRTELGLDDDSSAASLASEAIALLRGGEEEDVDGLVSAFVLHAEASLKGRPADALASLQAAEKLVENAAQVDPKKSARLGELTAAAHKALGKTSEAGAARKRAEA